MADGCGCGGGHRAVRGRARRRAGATLGGHRRGRGCVDAPGNAASSRGWSTRGTACGFSWRSPCRHS
jgi:hypothetical protein